MAEKIELAKAYIQIVPSFQGLQKELNNALDKANSKMADSFSEAGTQAGKTLGENVSKGLEDSTPELSASAKLAATEFANNFNEVVGKATKLGLAATLAGVVASYTEGGKLQQSLGGVETLFKGSFDTVVENAEEAFKTAGLSANDYMEQATSFAASLIDSLGGDTEAAAAAADTAMVDMADNANKYGTNIENIQNAYQGFMRKSYVMLDNLKLGYGGTKTEMERLLADAEAISGVDYNIDSLSDVFEAIHVIQKNLGITGTTAEEASNTFSGSFAAMKSAAQNLVGYMSTGAGDVDEAFKDLKETTGTFLSNVAKMAWNIYDSLGSIGRAIPAAFAGEALMLFYTKLKTLVTEAGTLKALLSQIGPTIKMTVGVAVAAIAGSIISSWVDGLTEDIDELVEREDFLTDEQLEVIESVEATSKAFADTKADIESLNEDYETSAAAADSMVNRLFELQGQTGLTTDEQAEMETLISSLNEEYEGLNLKLDEQTGLLNLSKESVEEYIAAQLKQAKANAYQEKLTELYKEQYQAQKDLEEATEAYEHRQDGLVEVEEKLKKAIEERDLAARSNITTVEKIAAYEEEIKAIKDASGDISASYSMAWENVRNTDAAIDDLIAAMSSDEYSNAVDGIVEANGKYVYSMATVTEDGIELVEGSFADLMSTITDLRTEYQENLKDTTQDVLDGFNIFDTVDSLWETATDENGNEYTYLKTTKEDLQTALDGTIALYEQWTEQLQELYDRGINENLLQMLKETGISSAAEVNAMTTMTDTELQEYSKKFETAYGYAEDYATEKLEDTREETARQIAGLVSDVTGQKENLKGAFELLAGYGASGYIEEIRRQAADMKNSTVDLINSQSLYDQFKEVGYNAGAGFGHGMSEAMNEAVSAAVMGASTVVEAMKAVLVINSPSRATKQIGEFVSLGLAQGITDEADTVEAAADDVGRAAYEGIQGEFAVPTANLTARAALESTTHLDGTVTVSGEQTLLQQAVALLTAIRNKSTEIILDGKTVGTTVTPYVDSTIGQAYAYAGRGLAM